MIQVTWLLALLFFRADSSGILRGTDPKAPAILVTRDEAGRIVQIGCRAWTHSFIYGDRGLAGEIDCRGVHHEFVGPPILDKSAGTALRNHSHVGKASQSATRFEYDAQGRITAVEKK